MALADADVPIGTLVTRLIEETRGLAYAEVALVKAKVTERIAAYRAAIVYFALAGVLALAALVAMLVGAIMALATLIGPGFATLAVVAATLLIAGILALVGKSRLKSSSITAGA